METNDTVDYLLWEHGGTGQGAFVGFRDGHLRVRAGSRRKQRRRTGSIHGEYGSFGPELFHFGVAGSDRRSIA